MKTEHEEHLAEVINEFALRVDAKYRKGQAEHGGELWEVPTSTLVEFAIDEAIDQVTYLLTLKNQIARTVVT